MGHIEAHRIAEPPKILFVAMQDSIHTARWMDMIADQGWDLHLFPIADSVANPFLRSVTIHHPRLSQTDRQSDVGDHRSRLLQRVYFEPTLQELGGKAALRVGGVRLGESDATAPTPFTPGALASVVDRLRPDLVHSLEFQHAGYLVLRAKEDYGRHFPPWLASNWGSDIYYFKQFDGHNKQIRRLLQSITLYSCECHRDVGLARGMGYAGPTLPIIPNSGGFDLSRIGALRGPSRPSQRKTIMLKGYEHFAGRALTALAALEKCADILKDYTIYI